MRRLRENSYLFFGELKRMSDHHNSGQEAVGSVNVSEMNFRPRKSKNLVYIIYELGNSGKITGLPTTSIY